MKIKLAKVLGVLEAGVIVLALISLTNVRGSKVLELGISPIILFLVVMQWKRILHIALKEKLLWLLTGFALASVLWSAAPGATLTATFGFVWVQVIGLYLARYTLNDQLRLIASALGITALVCLVIGLIAPEVGVLQGLDQGAWKGIFNSKNLLGRYMVLSALVFLLLAISSMKLRWLMWSGFGLSLFLIMLSTSKSALVLLLTFLPLLLVYTTLRWSYSWIVPFLFISFVTAGGSLAILLVSRAETIVNALGKDLTLTGRTELWAALLDKIWERPWLGYGYGGFWHRTQEGESADIWAITGWQPPHAHNGYLEILIELGLVGLLLFALIFLAAFLRAVIWVRLTRSVSGLWPPVYLTLLLLINLTESTLISNNMFSALFITTLLSTHNNLASSRI